MELNKIFLSFIDIIFQIQDLQDFLEGAEHGAILFTMGFVFETSFVPRERIDALFSVFARLPQRVVMRLDKGGNVLI